MKSEKLYSVLLLSNPLLAHEMGKDAFKIIFKFLFPLKILAIIIHFYRQGFEYVREYRKTSITFNGWGNDAFSWY
jgi:hypothetical protein